MVNIPRAVFKPLALLLAFFQKSPCAVEAKSIETEKLSATGTTRFAEPKFASAESQGLQGMRALVSRLMADPLFRVRFAQNPEATIRDLGIDPDRQHFPKTLNEQQVQAFIIFWTRPWEPTTPWVAPNADAADNLDAAHVARAGDTPEPAIPMPVYGPPAGPRDGRLPDVVVPPLIRPPPSPPQHPAKRHHPGDFVPAPVYGPPPGRTKQ